MIRTQISLDEKEYAAAKREAAALGVSVAEFVRRAVREKLPKRGKHAWSKYIGSLESGDPRASETIDEVVYGQKP